VALLAPLGAGRAPGADGRHLAAGEVLDTLRGGA
jgi:hypothetical protein